ncbi:MAG: histidinol-phosphate transaminase [Chloroflexota bacterium]
MKEVEEYIVPWMKGKPMYISPHIELAWERPELHRLMSNESPYSPSKMVKKAIQKYSARGNHYPDQGLVVRSKLAEINGLSGPENVLIGNGSSEVFDTIFRSLIQVGEEIIQHTPCFGIYRLRCEAAGGKMVSVPMLYEDNDFIFDVDAVIDAITDKTTLIIIANPNNPTGNFMSKEDFGKVAETGVPFIIDEAYIEFSGLEKSRVEMVKEYKNVLITRTLSKAYGLGGMRFGYALGHEEFIAQLSAMLLPWNVGTIPMWAALAALEDVDGLNERVEFNNSEAAYIEDALSDISGLVIFQSKGNFILFDGTDAGKVGNEMVAYALEKSFILRSQPDLYGRNGWFRLTIGTKEENRELIKIIREFFAR